jgi:transcriptional regulator with XRE-family HTH domain
MRTTTTMARSDYARDLGRHIRAAREDRGMSQRELARRLHPPVSHAAVSDLEHGITELGVERLRQIALAVGVPEVDLAMLPVPHRAPPPGWDGVERVTVAAGHDGGAKPAGVGREG